MRRSELERIQWGPEPGQPLGGLGSVRIVARCQDNCEDVLARAREVLLCVCSDTDIPLSDPGKWRHCLPDWFVEQFVREPTLEENAQYLLLPYEERMKPERNKWTLSSWLYWFQPGNRHWFWWDAECIDKDTLVVAIEVDEWPFPWDALKWLLTAAGAQAVEAEK